MSVAYYCCNRRPARDADCTRYVRTDRIEPAAWHTILRLLDDPELILDQLERQTASHAAAGEHAREKRAKLERQLKDTDTEEMRVVRLYREEKIDATLLEAQLQELRAKREALKRQIDALGPSLDTPQLTEDTRHAICAFTQNLRRGEPESVVGALASVRCPVHDECDGSTSLTTSFLPVMSFPKGLGGIGSLRSSAGSG